MHEPKKMQTPIVSKQMASPHGKGHSMAKHKVNAYLLQTKWVNTRLLQLNGKTPIQRNQMCKCLIYKGKKVKAYYESQKDKSPL